MAVTANQHRAGTQIPRRPLPSSALTLTFEGSQHRSKSVRLTRRGRLVVLLTLLTLLLVAFSLGRFADSEAATHRPGDAAPTVPYGQTTVHQGESLWAVARRVAPDQDPRSVVLQLRELNQLDSASVRAGQQLLLPAKA